MREGCRVSSANAGLGLPADLTPSSKMGVELPMLAVSYSVKGASHQLTEPFVPYMCTRSAILTVEVPNITGKCAYHPASSERDVSLCESTMSYPREHCLDVQFRIATLYLLLKKHIDVFSFLLLFTGYYILLCKDMCLYLSRLFAWGTISESVPHWATAPVKRFPAKTFKYAVLKKHCFKRMQ